MDTTNDAHVRLCAQLCWKYDRLIGMDMSNCTPADARMWSDSLAQVICDARVARIDWVHITRPADDVVSELASYVRNHENDLDLEPGEKAIFMDLALILDGKMRNGLVIP